MPGRVEQTDVATPLMGLVLGDLTLPFSDQPLEVEEPSLGVLGDMNERVYRESRFSPLAQSLCDERFRVYGLRYGAPFVCVAMTVTIGNDLGIYYVATEETHRRRGLASRLVNTSLTRARAEGLRSSTLQASEDGLPVWERLGYRQVGTMRGFIRPSA